MRTSCGGQGARGLSKGSCWPPRWQQRLGQRPAVWALRSIQADEASIEVTDAPNVQHADA